MSHADPDLTYPEEGNEGFKFGSIAREAGKLGSKALPLDVLPGGRFIREATEPQMWWRIPRGLSGSTTAPTLRESLESGIRYMEARKGHSGTDILTKPLDMLYRAAAVREDLPKAIGGGRRAGSFVASLQNRIDTELLRRGTDTAGDFIRPGTPLDQVVKSKKGLDSLKNTGGRIGLRDILPRPSRSASQFGDILKVLSMRGDVKKATEVLDSKADTRALQRELSLRGALDTKVPSVLQTQRGLDTIRPVGLPGVILPDQPLVRPVVVSKGPDSFRPGPIYSPPQQPKDIVAVDNPVKQAARAKGFRKAIPLIGDALAFRDWIGMESRADDIARVYGATSPEAVEAELKAGVQGADFFGGIASYALGGAPGVAFDAYTLSDLRSDSDGDFLNPIGELAEALVQDQISDAYAERDRLEELIEQYPTTPRIVLEQQVAQERLEGEFE